MENIGTCTEISFVDSTPSWW